jgi:putative spermidine/putrescine transport system permease protein
MTSTQRARRFAWLWVAVAVIYLLFPLLSMVWASLTKPNGSFDFSPYTTVLTSEEFVERFLFSVRAALLTIVVSMLLIVPTAYWVQLKMPRFRPIIEFLTVVPLVIPALLLTFGLIRFFNSTPLTNSRDGVYIMMIGAYAVISFPFMYRTVDAGMQAINVRVLTEAAQSLGAGWVTILRRVIFPNMVTAILNGAFVTFAIVIGEYTIASLLSQPAFAPYMLDLNYRQGDQALALGIISFLLTWLAIALLQRLGRGRRLNTTGIR